MNQNWICWSSRTLLVCVPLLLAACSKENNAPPSSTVNQPHPTAPTVAPAGDPTATLSALTQALRRYSFEKRRVPAAVEELLTAGYLQSLPTPPAGKQFVIDKSRVVVELANR